MKNDLYELINKTTDELLKLRIKYPFCSICGKPTRELFIYTLPEKDHYWARWVCYECFEQLEVGYEI